jgi:hypothetical protein
MYATAVFIALTQQDGVAATPSDGTPAVAAQGLRGISRSLQANDGIVPRLRHDRRFTNSFQLFTVRSSSTWATESASRKKKNISGFQ